MPNWCHNELTISGSAESIAAIKNQLAQPYELSDSSTLSGDLLLMNMVKPWGSDEEESAYHGGGDAWFDLHLEHWGTKWEVEADLLPERCNETTLAYEFQSAWSPPLEAITTYSAKWPEATFILVFDESGNDFAGRYEFRGGENTSREDSPSRQFYCHICENHSYCEWGNPLECPYNEDSEPDGPHETFAILLHAVAENGSDGEKNARLISAWVALVEAGTETMDSWRQQQLENAFLLSPTTTVEERVGLLRGLPSVPTWIAHAALSGIQESEIERALADANLHELTRIGTVGYALGNEH